MASNSDIFSGRFFNNCLSVFRPHGDRRFDPLTSTLKQIDQYAAGFR